MYLKYITAVLIIIALIFLLIGLIKKNKILRNIGIGLLVIIVVFWKAFWIYALHKNDKEYRDRLGILDKQTEPKDTNEFNIEWNEISMDGVNEELLVKNIETNDLEKIATLIQSLSAEIAQKEKEDIDFYLSAGWYKYMLDSPQFNEVISMGTQAIKPLYLIIYKSPNQGLYEYICTKALAELVHFDSEMDDWATSKQFLEKLNQKIISDRAR